MGQPQQNRGKTIHNSIQSGGQGHHPGDRVIGGQRASFSRQKRFRARLITLGLILMGGLVSSLRWFPDWGGLAAAHWRGTSDIVVIDSTLANQAPWQKGLSADHQTVVVSSGQGLAAVTQALANHQNVRAVHLVTHGRPGGLVLGGEELRLDNLQQWNDELKQWRSYLHPGADLLIYGCEVAQGIEGQQFLSIVQALTRADVAASTTLTGPAALGGDWVLETLLGQIQTPLPWSTATLSTLPGVLKQITLTSTADSGPGTLRTAIHQANALPVAPKGITIDTVDDRVRANRGAIAGANGIGIGGIGTIANAGGGGFGGLGNAGNGGNGGDGGPEGGQRW